MSELYTRMDTIINKVAPDMKAFRRLLHMNPEPAFKEIQTSDAIAAQLQEIAGLEITRNIGKTGIVALLGKDKKGTCVALRADMDCLRMDEQNSFDHASKNEGMMHACGHDGHMACLVGAAKVLGEIQADIPGPVKFIFQPAEENYAGAHEMIKEGVLENPRPDAIFALHGTPSLPVGEIGYRSGAAMAASRYFKIVIQGKGTHAAMPHRGVDPVLVGSHIVCAAQSIVARNIDPLEAGLISFPLFRGGTAPNVIPVEVELEGTLRALSNETRAYLEKRLSEVVHHTALGFGATATIDFFGGYPLLKNDARCAEYVANVATSTAGVKRVIADFPPSLGAEDFAFYLEEIPGLFWWLGLHKEDADYLPLHNPIFDFNDETIDLAIRLHCRFVLESPLLFG